MKLRNLLLATVPVLLTQITSAQTPVQTPLQTQPKASAPSATGLEHATKIVISRSASRPPTLAPEKNFTGSVRVTQLFSPVPPARASAGLVTFAPAARSNWHTHPLGQTLVVTEGEGLVQQWGGPVQIIKKGDVIWTPPGQKHWHGSTPTSNMTHIAISEILEGKAVEWLERVTDQQYNQKPAAENGAKQ